MVERDRNAGPVTPERNPPAGSRWSGLRRRLTVRLLLVFAGFATAPLLLTALFFTMGVRFGWISVEPEAPRLLQLFALELAAGGALAVGLLWWYLSTRVAHPLRLLADIVTQVGENAAPVQHLRFAADDELAEAAESLNQMAQKLTSAQTDLRGQVEARTKELGRALGELQLLRKLNEAIIHNIPSGIAVLNQDARLLYFNTSFGNKWQVDPRLLGQRLGDICAGGPLGEIAWQTELRRLHGASGVRHNIVVETGEWPHRRVLRYSLFTLPTGEFDVPLRLVGDTFCMAFLAPRECAGVCEDCFAHSDTWTGHHALLLVDDITEQREMEAQLIQSEKLAALGQLSAGVAHEMRNPLSAIYSAAFYIGDVLTDEEPDLQEVQDYVALIQRNVDRAQRTVTNILNFARPSGAGQTTCDLSDLVDQTLAILDKAMVDQGVELHRDLAPGIEVRCKPETVKQALLNLIVNAMQAMEEGGTLSLSVKRRPDGQPLLAVRDTGIGIPKEHLKQIFNPFFTTKPAGQGTGLGLCIARQAIENDGGRLEVESEEGKGTTFLMYLPTGDPAAEPASTNGVVA